MPQDSTSRTDPANSGHISDTADNADINTPGETDASQDPEPPYVFTPQEEAALVGEDEEYRERHRTRMARARRVLKDELTRKIDHILYTEWDPIGVHGLGDFDCFDEYHRYLPWIVEMVRQDASLEALSDQLLEIESFMLGPDTIRRRCDVIAVMLTQHGPHAGAHPFAPVIDTQTPEAAYRSVLDLVTQTRLDAYEKRWDAVCCGYEEAVRICRAHLSRRRVLIGTCLNNLAQAYTLTGQFEEARAALEEAAAKLKPRHYKTTRTYAGVWNRRLYAWCLGNLINHLECRGERRSAMRYARALVSHSIRNDGKRFAHEARDRLRRLVLREQVPRQLGCSRIAVEQDSCDVIGEAILIE